MKLPFHILRFSLIISLLVACGPRGSKETKTNHSSDANREVPCTKDKCPPVPLYISANPVQNNILIGTLDNLSTPWKFTGVAQGGAKRDVRMKAYNPPKGGAFMGQGTLNIDARYGQGVLEAVDSQIPIQVVIRDVSLCQQQNPKQSNLCADMNQKGMERYESTSEFPWTIGVGDPNAFVDPTFTQAQGRKLGSNAGINGCTNGFIQGGLPGLASGSFLGGIVGGVVKCMSSSVENLGQ